MTKLQAVVEILQENENYFLGYLDCSLYSLYEINIIDFNNLTASIGDIKKLFYISMSTRQRTRNNPFEGLDREEIENQVILSLETLNNNGLVNVSERYYGCLNILNKQIFGAGQKIITMFIKFVLMHSNNLNDFEELKKILWIPLDNHLIKFLFTRFYKKNKYVDSNRFDLFTEDINAANLNLKFNKDNTLKENKLYDLQKRIREKFKSEHIDKPQIILDYLWVVGSTRCVNTKFSPIISCDNCLFSGSFLNEAGEWEKICKRNIQIH